MNQYMKRASLGINHDDVEVFVAKIGPEQAERILAELNGKNRPISKARINGYSAMMSSGGWSFNGDPIRFDEDGHLADGQHRLTSVIASGEEIEFLVIKNLPKTVSRTIDTGKTRNRGDALSIDTGFSGIEGHAMASAISCYILHKSGKAINSAGAHHHLVNPQAVCEFYERHRDFCDAAAAWFKTDGVHRGVLLRSHQMFLHMLFSKIDEAYTKRFLEAVLKGTNIGEDSTEYKVRQVLISAKMNRSKMTEKVKVYSVIKCWNSVRAGRTIKKASNTIWNPARDSNNMPTAK